MSELLNNRAHRIATLKHVIRHLHEGKAPAEVKAQLRALVRECDATEIAQMEQELIAEGVPVGEIMGMCDLHSQVVAEVLTERPVPLLPPGHPVTTFRKENTAIAQHVRSIREALAALAPGAAQDPATAAPPDAVRRCLSLLNELMDVDKHYARKENLLFPILERHGITGPSKVMWGKDDEVRTRLASLREALTAEGATREEWGLVRSEVAEPALHAVEEMIFKEERILLPMALQTLTGIEWGEVWTQSPQFGWCIVDPDEGYRPPAPAAAPAPAAPMPAAPGGGAGESGLRIAGRADPPQAAVLFPTGAMTPAQLMAMFSVLPVDLTFVDADDRVRFFSEGPKRVFVRPKAVIGRKVQHCHPPASVDVVERILGDFRCGRQDVADFWIDYRGRFVFIRYFAMRDADGTYVGTLEVTQDLTRERALEGQRRLLQYDAPPVGNTA